jgi:peptidylprolyl isomerase
MELRTQSGPSNTVRPGDTVRIHYTCRLDDNSVFATTRNRAPLEFVVGESQIIPGLQEGVLGMKPGESKTFQIGPEKAFGPYHDEMTATLDRNLVPPDLYLEIGAPLRVKHSDGHESEVRVTAFNESSVTVDGNHPLAGKALTMEVELVELEAA